MSITLDQVTKRYQGSPVVNDVSLDIGDGEFFVLLGPSGSGKSTLLRAIAGALAHKPEVLLLDEPFGALDAKIREELRRTIRQVQRELGITTVLVTHDQEEAFALADRIGVMNLGRLLEIGKPQELYARPATRFVATFLGAANLLLARP